MLIMLRTMPMKVWVYVIKVRPNCLVASCWLTPDFVAGMNELVVGSMTAQVLVFTRDVMMALLFVHLPPD